ncbi:MAG: LuxR family transcriptional regulator [Mycobacterium sp.]|nr:LuxR family transcriptional regulator [Mycobacterium sp.]
MKAPKSAKQRGAAGNSAAKVGRQPAIRREDEEARLVAELRAAHEDIPRRQADLVEARQRRRDAAVKLRESGRSYAWIGEQIGVSAQAIEGSVKLRDRGRKR